jgi:hypothetical protein
MVGDRIYPIFPSGESQIDHSGLTLTNDKAEGCQQTLLQIVTAARFVLNNERCSRVEGQFQVAAEKEALSWQRFRTLSFGSACL